MKENNEGEKYEEINKGGVGSITRLQVPTKKFYDDLTFTLKDLQETLKKNPDDFDAQFFALTRV